MPPWKLPAHATQSGLLWPDVAALRRWWQEHAPRFQAGRCLAGRPLAASSAARVLQDPQCTQLQRHHAALFLRVQGATAQLFDVRAPLWRQRHQAAGLGPLSLNRAAT